MKTLLLLAVITAVTACDPRGPTEGGARAVTGVVELRFGPRVERYDLRVDRQHDDFAPTLTPIGPAAGRTPTDGLFGLAFVKLGPGPEKPFVIPTPQGAVTARLTYKPLGPWHVLDRATISVTGSPLGAGPEFTVAVLEPRLVR